MTKIRFVEKWNQRVQSEIRAKDAVTRTAWTAFEEPYIDAISVALQLELIESSRRRP